MLILDLWGMGFHAVVVFSLGKDLLFKSVLGRCVSVSDKGKNCKNKICQTVASISILGQFHEFFNTNFGWILLFGPTWRRHLHPVQLAPARSRGRA